MRKVLFFTWMSILSLSIQSCKKDSQATPEAFNFEREAGMWTPYELVAEDGTVYPGPFTAQSLFGVYAESFLLNKDKSFIPVIWVNKNEIYYKNNEKGMVSYLAANKKIVFKNDWELEYELVKVEGDDMWLKSSVHGLYKLKRQKD